MRAPTLLICVLSFICFSACFTFFKKSASPTGHLIDIHNSALSRMFLTETPQGLSDTTYPVSIKSMKAINAKHIILSLGVARFSMMHADTIQIEHVLSFLRQFNQVNEDKNSLLCFKNDNCNKIHVMIAIEGSHLLRGELNLIDSLYNNGVRMLGIAHWFHNEFLVAFHGDSSTYRMQPPSRLTHTSVLSEKGIELIEKIISKGMYIDISHMPEKGFWQLVNLNKNRSPLIASHANLFSVCPVERNLKDEQIDAIIKSGGIVGLTLHSPLITTTEGATIEDFSKHVQYFMKHFGNKNIAIGTDMEGRIKLPEGIEKFNDLGKLRNKLHSQGLSAEDIDRLFYKNALKLLF